MKRRLFLSTTGTLGIAGVVSSASVVSSAYSSLSTNVSLGEFSPATRTILENFVFELTQNIQELGLDTELVGRIAMPEFILHKDIKTGNQSITYKNKVGEYVSFSIKKGVEIIRITKDL